MNLETEISRRFDKYFAGVLKTFALLRGELISIREARRCNHVADQEIQEIRKRISKFAATKKAKRKTTATLTLKPSPSHIMSSGVSATCGVA